MYIVLYCTYDNTFDVQEIEFYFEGQVRKPPNPFVCVFALRHSRMACTLFFFFPETKEFDDFESPFGKVGKGNDASRHEEEKWNRTD